MPLILNKTNLCLVSKVEQPSSTNDFRPISLCNFIYKIISKLLACRLKKLLPRLLYLLQSAFVYGRVISDNTIITQEVIHCMTKKKGKTGLMFIKS